MAAVELVGALIARVVAITRHDPLGAAVLLGSYLLPRVWPFTVGEGLYWTAWWTLLGCWVVGSATRAPWQTGGARPKWKMGWRPWSSVIADAGSQSTAEGGHTGDVIAPAGAHAGGVQGAELYSSTAEAGGGGAGVSAGIGWEARRQTARERRASELRRLLALESALKARIVGQDHAVSAIARALVRQVVGVGEGLRRPLVSVLAAGPTGVGKTETAKALAEILGRPLLVYDMANFAEPHTVAALIGAPPGYAGSERPGRLVSDLQRHPDAIVLLDEIDKAHPTLFDPFMQVLEEGRFVELSRGERADFGKAIIVATTNLLRSEATLAWTDDPAHIRRMLLSARSEVPGLPAAGFGLRLELIARIDLVLLYKPISLEVLDRIAQGYIPTFINRTAAQLGVQLKVTVDSRLVDELVSRCDPQFGVRDLKRVVQERLGNALVDDYLPWMLRAELPSAVEIKVHDGKVVATYR
ncbi:MAG: hypothetical protein AUH31_06250 [Armatimonadetes bacterium 13_1_40CM_64_14]|nr:MAG: hypothetical protein AUH31_06250 [Armatimonadetes bacterium 13_1_40CM_64_14]